MRRPGSTSLWMVGLAVGLALARDPFFDGIRTTPRFRQIMAQMEQDVAAMRRRAVAAHDTLFAMRTGHAE